MTATTDIDTTAEDLAAEHSTAIAAPARPSHVAVTPSVEAAELVARLDVIRTAMRTAMQEGVDYGRIPGVDKPTLFKPGAEKLGVLFQLDIQPESTKTWGPGEHLTVETIATVFHAPTGTRLGKGEGLATTREKKHAKRQAQRLCPACGVAAIIKGKQEYGGGWVCFKKKDGCGAKFPDGDQAIESQEVGTVENPELPDAWNNVVKMAAKRARVDAVLAVTGASALFTQDAEDMGPQEPAAPPAPKPAPVRHARLKALFRKNKVKAGEMRAMVRGSGFEISDTGNVLDAIDALSDEQAATIVGFLEQGPVPVAGAQDVPGAAPGEFEHARESANDDFFDARDLNGDAVQVGPGGVE